MEEVEEKKSKGYKIVYCPYNNFKQCIGDRCMVYMFNAPKTPKRGNCDYFGKHLKY